jgi:DNA-binding transcriptional LysR family regulator
LDRFEAMSILLASVEEGSFSAASRKLNMPLATVSRKVADLEAHLKTRLLVRSTRKLMLTEPGVAYVAASKAILEQVEEAEAQANGEYSVPKGELTITAPVVFGRLHILPVVAEFLARFAEINVHLVLADRIVSLIDDHIDMAVRIGELPDSNMIATKVGTIRRVICASPSYLAAHGVPRTPGSLRDHTCVTFSELMSGASWTVKNKDGKMESVRPFCRLKINTAESAIDAAVQGVGLTNVLSYQVARYVQEGALEIVLQDFEPPPIAVHLVHAHQGLLPLKMRRFLEFAAPRIRKSLLAAQSTLAVPSENSEI